VCYTFCLCPALDRVFSGERPSGSVTIRITCIQALDMSVTILGNDTGIYTQVHIEATFTSWVRTIILTLKHVFFLQITAFLLKTVLTQDGPLLDTSARAFIYVIDRGPAQQRSRGSHGMMSKMTVIRCWYLLCKLIIHRIKPPYI